MPESKLEEILTAKRSDIAARKEKIPIEALKDAIAELGRPRNFFAAVTRKPAGKLMSVIAAVKPVDSRAFDPVKVAKSLESAGADALCVPTDEPHFGGKLEWIHAIRDMVKLPVLRKDFIVDPYQVYESRAAGADAILLIAEALRTDELIDLQILATEMSLTCLIEVHDIDNLMRVRDHVIGFPHRSYSLLGINNRNLLTSVTDIGTTLRMAELVEDKGVLISESGIAAREDVRKLAKAGIRAAIVGECLLRADDVTAELHTMFDLPKRK